MRYSVVCKAHVAEKYNMKLHNSALKNMVLLIAALAVGVVAWGLDARAQDSADVDEHHEQETTNIIIRANDDGATPQRRSQSSENVIHGTAGGRVRATQFGISQSGPCMGWIPETPQYTFTLNTQSIVRIRTQSTTDTTLIIRGKYGKDQVLRCYDDDNDSTNPSMQDTLPAGKYEIYMGAWSGGTRAPFTMRVEIELVRSR